MEFKVHFDSIELHQPSFGKRPEGFNAINRGSVSFHKLITSMVHSVMLVIANIYQAIIASPLIGIDNTLNVYSSSDNPLERSLGGILGTISVYT